MAPYTFGKFQIHRELGRGAMGVVYEAHDPSRGAEVALKVMVNGPGTPDQRRALQRRFDQEARVLARLNHPHVVHLFDQGEVSGRHYFAMELVRGTTLRDRLRFQGPLAGPDVTRLALELCDALDHLQQHGVIHRDIKPENIMLLPNGSATLMDFGIAWAASESEGGGNSGGFQGSPSYMSPEQVASQELDHRSDIYSLAVTLYEAATGRRAVEGSSIPEITHKVATEYPLPPAGLPPYFQTILLRAMAKDPATRYGSATEMANDLRAGRAPILAPVMAPAPLSVAPPSTSNNASLPRSYLGSAPNSMAEPAPLPAGTSDAPLENWMPPPMPPQETYAPWLTSPKPQATAVSHQPPTGLLTCRTHPALAGIARCAECGHPLCYHCLLETPTRGVICRSCGFGPKSAT